MANKYASDYSQPKSKLIQSVSLPNEANTIEGDKVLWDCDVTPTAARVLTVRPFDESRHGEYRDVHKPFLVIKCAVDCGTYEITVKDADANTLYTFTEDRSSTPIYIALHLDANGAWELI